MIHSLGNITPAHFLKQYWQKRPLLVRNAFSNFRDPLTPDELAGLSLEKDVDSRLVMERGGSKPWEVTLGPQKASRLRSLPSSHWTLLVQGVDRFVPGVSALLDSFRFIPDWRVEDVMISFAPRGGTVGPHVDSYDVFLLQGKGRRRWRIDKNATKALRPGLDLRILKKFQATGDWILNPGDMLYLPPDLAHYGTALEECLTYSIGFRAPTGMDLLVAAQERLSQSSIPIPRYSDPELRPARLSGEIPPAAMKKMRQLMESSLRRLGEEEFNTMVGGLLTAPKGSAVFDSRKITAASLRAKLIKGKALVRSPGSRIAFLHHLQSTDLFADGQRFHLSPGLSFAAKLLTEEKHLTLAQLSRYLGNKDFIQLLVDLLYVGTFQLPQK